MELYNLREKIINEINNSGLPIDAIYFVFEQIKGEITSLYNLEIEKFKEKQLQEENDKLNSKKKGDDK